MVGGVDKSVIFSYPRGSHPKSFEGNLLFRYWVKLCQKEAPHKLRKMKHHINCALTRPYHIARNRTRADHGQILNLTVWPPREGRAPFNTYHFSSSSAYTEHETLTIVYILLGPA